ncbi:hypothetical protein LSTR_LSTR006860 [Laodelphax striatellus]|uniref:Lysosome-associated membrane glycoprotein 2-like luminal domain-containing protein n=1 Tax=Laodelphax striatellus TaxID=195883 RepID=A0A482XFG0_LAOST|nr:hypothetical protein LSTR_LSTR006860 [Laodelphax striatellus]
MRSRVGARANEFGHLLIPAAYSTPASQSPSVVVHSFSSYYIMDHPSTQRTTCLLIIATILLARIDTQIGVSGQKSSEEPAATVSKSKSVATVEVLAEATAETVTVAAGNLNAEESRSTWKPEKKELTNKIVTTTPDTSSSGAALYRLKDNNEGGGTCILIKMDAVLNYTYNTKLGDKIERDQYVPDDSQMTIYGVCNEDDSRISLRWQRDFILTFEFQKTPGGERWFVENIELKVDTNNRIFEHFINKGKAYTLSSKFRHRNLLFPTPVGNAYTCHKELKFALASASPDISARIYFLSLKLEPFIFKNDDFGPEYQCSATGQGPFRSETAPLIVGSTLAFCCLATVTGYGIFRYFKIKKVQYDTME